jgi:hypothetical protein
MFRSIKTGRIRLLIIILAGALMPMPARAQHAGVEMRVTPAMSGHVRYGEWLPLHVHLTNDGEDVDAELQAEVSGSTGRATYAAQAPLPAGARKEVILYVQPPSFAQTVNVRLVSGEQILAEADVDITTHPRSTYLIATLAATPDAFAPLNALTLSGRDRVELLPLNLDTFPARAEVLRSIDCLILSGLDTSSLTSAQAHALETWVEQGGRLLIGGGVAARRTLAGLPEALRPVELGEMVELAALDGLADFVTHPVQVPGPFAATLPQEVQGLVLIEEGNRPILVQAPLGDSWVGYLALDPAASPFDAWAGTLPFWRRMLEPGAALEANTPRDVPVRVLESEQMSHALTNLPALELPSARWLALLLGLYIALVGPINYLVLRRLHRLDIAWVTIPTLTILFSVAGYGMGYSHRGNDVIINQVSILPLYPGNESVSARSYVGLFSPTRRSYDVWIEGDALIGPLLQSGRSYDAGSEALSILQGEPALVRGLAINQWAMQSFQAETQLGGMAGAVETGLAVDQNGVHGTITNHLEHSLEDVILVFGNRFALLGDVDAGQEVEVDMAFEGDVGGIPFPWALFEQSHQQAGEPSTEFQIRRSVLEALFHTNWGSPLAPSNPMLLAWTDLNPLEVEVSQVRVSHETTTLLVYHMPLPTAEGHVELPLGVLTGRGIEFEGEAGECGPSGEVFLSRGQAILEYTLPANVRGILPSRLTFQVTADGDREAPQVAFYDWSQGDWEELDPVELDAVHIVSDPHRFVGRVGGGIRLRVSQESRSGACYHFNLGLEGDLEVQTREVSSE